MPILEHILIHTTYVNIQLNMSLNIPPDSIYTNNYKPNRQTGPTRTRPTDRQGLITHTHNRAYPVVISLPPPTTLKRMYTKFLGAIRDGSRRLLVFQTAVSWSQVRSRYSILCYFYFFLYLQIHKFVALAVS